MKVRFLLIIIVLSGTLSGWAEDIPGKKCNDNTDCKEQQECVWGIKKCLWYGVGIDDAGCCYNNIRLSAGFIEDLSGNKEWAIDGLMCGKDLPKLPLCAWSTKDGKYVCVKSIDNQTTFYEDPSGKHPRECDFTCHPRCEGKECGPDWCGGTCGKCPAGQVCTKDGKCCTPHCEGKECGPDGCGGTCGECQKEQQCVLGRCVWPGVDIKERPGCCYGQYAISRAYTPEEGRFLIVYNCKEKGLICAWDDEWKEYDCVESIDNKRTFSEDPTGKNPKECDFSCTPDCEGKNCGDDHCGGSCGKCGPGQVCTEHGKCCTPHCEGKECGPDGCGGSCGQCDYPVEYCMWGKCVNDYGCTPHDYPGCPSCSCEECVCSKDPECCKLYWDIGCANLCEKECGGCKACVPDCTGKECGDDGCHGECGYCPKGKTCYKGKCVEHCSCGDRECGTSPCGDPCGKCPAGQECTEDGKCCTPHCEGKECGPDGCGGSCGTCPYNQVCRDGKCVKCSDKPMCKPEWDCGDDGCGHECGDCSPDGVCADHVCYSACVSYCPKEYECGDDGCGGSCGHCGPCEECISHHCKPIPDCEVPPEPVPDTAEDVQVAKDVVEVVDSGKTGKDVKGDGHGNGNDRDEKKSGDSIKDGQGIDNGSVPPMKPSGGGCTTGKGSSSGILLILMGILGLFFLRKQSHPRS